MSRTVVPALVTVPGPPQFHDLHRPEQLQAVNAHIFPSLGSLEWFIRVNRDELQQRGAMVEITGRTFLHGPRFIEAAVEIGARRSALRANCGGQ